ncbi:MAG: HlyD family secretion protein [Acidobacteria bacterium]|nr:HlyD family secretion protein [Acidobacteriota bacterium]
MPAFARHPRFRLVAGLAVVAVVVVLVWMWIASGRESTDDAQIDAHVTPIAARVAGTVAKVAAEDNQRVDAGQVLVELDPRDFEVAVAKARAELADAEATAQAARSGVPISTTTTAANVTTAQGSLIQARSGVDEAQKEIEAAQARVATARAKEREAEADAANAAKNVERLRGLLAKDEVSQQQFDAAATTADAQRAAVDSARAQVTEAEAELRVAESHLVQAQAGEQQALAGLRTAQTGPEQVTAMQARAQAAEAGVSLAKAALQQAELNLGYTTIRAPSAGVVSHRSVEVGQVVQPGQPLLALVAIEDVWVTANFKETQVADIHPGQRATVKVDAFGGRTFEGHVDSVAPATGARFSLLPPENATGNFVKVVQRVPVKIVLEPGQDPEHQLRPGMSAEPTIHLR